MMKFFPILAFAGLFLLISPTLRETLHDIIASGVGTIVKYSPWSYIGAVVGLLLFAMIVNYRSTTT